MDILHIAYLTDDLAKGPNVNVPKNVIYGNKYENVFLYNLYEKSNVIKKLLCNNYFDRKQYRDISLLPKPFNKPTIVIFQEVYHPEYCKIANYLISNNIPYIIVPRCSLTKEAQSKKKLKKLMGNWVMFNKFIRNASAINFLTENEFLESRTFKFKKHFIIGNGTEKKNNTNRIIKNNFFNISFIGRLDIYHKGIDLLLNAINSGKEDFRKYNFIFNFYGPDYNGNKIKIIELINMYGINDLVKINNQVFEEEKEKVLLSSDLFIHTSRLEGQPTSVIEAISYGIPVLVTPGTNISDIVKNEKLGFTASFNENSIKENLIYAYLKKDSLMGISKREIEYSNKNFNCDIIVQKNIKEYDKVIKG